MGRTNGFSRNVCRLNAVGERLRDQLVEYRLRLAWRERRARRDSAGPEARLRPLICFSAERGFESQFRFQVRLVVSTRGCSLRISRADGRILCQTLPICKAGASVGRFQGLHSRPSIGNSESMGSETLVPPESSSAGRGIIRQRSYTEAPHHLPQKFGPSHSGRDVGRRDVQLRKRRSFDADEHGHRELARQQLDLPRRSLRMDWNGALRGHG